MRGIIFFCTITYEFFNANLKNTIDIIFDFNGPGTVSLIKFRIILLQSAICCVRLHRQCYNIACFDGLASD